MLTRLRPKWLPPSVRFEERAKKAVLACVALSGPLRSGGRGEECPPARRLVFPDAARRHQFGAAGGLGRLRESARYGRLFVNRGSARRADNLVLRAGAA
jgi:hypothetical protein